jgi:intein/homing endonuclease
VAELLKNKLGLKILTDTGFSDFDGLLIKSVRELLQIKLSKTDIKCTLDHKVFLYDLSNKQASDLSIGDKVYTSYGSDIVTEIQIISEEQTYDVFNVRNNHRFYANDILVKNCEFLIYDETLINAVKLADLKGDEPKMTMGQTRWYKDIDPRCTYLISLDPSLGTGGDYAAIQVFELPSMEQIAEWRHNLTPVQGQVKNLREICTYIQNRSKEKGGSAQIYYSVENNTVGESALICISNIGEENFPGLFLSEPIRKGHVRKFRKGFNTTHKTKIAVCSQFKHMIETQKMKIHSKPLISELKNYVAHGVGYGAKRGESDDLVSATLLILRMSSILADWDPKIYEKMTDKITEDQMPMPIFVSTGF